MKKSIAYFLFFTLLILTLNLSACGSDIEETESLSDNSPVVYVTETGTKYHKNNCSYLSKSKIEITLEKAQDKGYTRCSKCKPPKELY